MSICMLQGWRQQFQTGTSVHALVFGGVNGMILPSERQILTNCQQADVYVNTTSVLSYQTSQLTDALVSQQVLATLYIIPKFRYEVIQSCWDIDPQQRPTFSRLVTTITSILDPLADYLDVSTFTEEQEIETTVTESPFVGSEKWNEEARQDGCETAETHFQSRYVLKNEEAEERTK